MNGLFRKAGLGAVLAATVLTAAAPSDAQRWGRGGYRGGYRGGGNVAAGALLGGIVGLGVGAAIADSRRPYYGYGNYYYDAPPPPPPVYRPYYNGYYDGGYYRPHCWNSWRWDPYYGRNVPSRVCD